MEEWEGKSCRIHIYYNYANLFYNAKKVTKITKNTITFIDRYDELHTYSREDIKHISSGR